MDVCRDQEASHRSRISVLYVASTLRRSGPTFQLHNLARYLDSDYFALHILTLSDEEADSLWQSFVEDDCVPASLRLSRLRGLLLGLDSLQEFANHLEPEIIHSHGFRSDWLVSRLQTKARRICTVRNFPQLDYLSRYGKIVGRVMVSMHTKALQRVDRCIGVSGAVSDNLRVQFGIDKTSVIHNGVDSERFCPGERGEKASLRAAKGLPNGRIWVVNGHLSEIKNPEFIIKGFQRLSDKSGWDSDYLLFLGSGPLANRCKELSRGNGRIIFAGRVRDVEQYLKASDYLISASRTEGCPNAVMEALACGLPVVLSGIPAHRELFELGVDIGALFSPGDLTSFSVAAERVRNGRYDNLSAAARAVVREHLDARMMARKYEKVYRECYSGRSL